MVQPSRFMLLGACLIIGAVSPLPARSLFQWSVPAVIHDEPQFPDEGLDARGLKPGRVGSQFPRAVQLSDKIWLVSYMTSDNRGYQNDPDGGTILEFARSTDNGRHWSVISSLKEPGRDLDNGRLIKLDNETLLLAYRSVRWGESYRILVRASHDGGLHWGRPTAVAANEGVAGGLSNPDRGLYEPDMLRLPGGDVAMMYADETHALGSPAYSQIISMKISKDGGASWGQESHPVRDLDNPKSRPGMPIWTKMRNGRYALVYELCGSDECNAWIKISKDPRNWANDLGRRIPDQMGAPYILSLNDGRLVVTSNSHAISVSRDYGLTWIKDGSSPWASKDRAGNLWPALIQTGSNEIGAMTSAGRPPYQRNGNNIQIKFGKIEDVSER